MPTAEETVTAPLLDGRYQLGACIGQGGSAKVYRAEDLLLGRTVAVKLMQGDVGALAAPSRVRTEVSVLASLTHPSLVELYDARIEPGRPSYLVMEYVQGPTLARRLHEAPLTVAECAALGCDLASALHAVHEAGIVHRDIKPANVLLAPAVLPGSGFRAKLADFGVALLVDTTRVTAAGTVVGTAAYLPPEQIRGDAATPPGDIYALGLVLIEALTGERGFPQATGIGAVMARLFDSPQVPKQFGEGWTDLLTRMTAAEPADRPPAAEVSHTIARLAAALPEDLAGRPELVPPDPSAAAPTQTTTAPTHPAPEIASAILPLPLVATPPSSPSTGPTVEFAVTGEQLMSTSVDASPTRRRISGALVAAVVALAAALCIVLGFWAAGATVAAAPQERLSSEPFVRVEPASDAGTGDPVVEDAVVDDAEPQTPVTETVDDKAAEEALREAEKQAEAEQRAQEQADREAEKAREQAERDAEKSGKDGKDGKDG